MTGLLAISDDTWTRLIFATIGLMIAVTNAINLWVSWRAAATGMRTHALVNSAMGRTLRLAATALREKAELTGNPGDVRSAEVAEKESVEHDARQARVDKRFGAQN